MLIGELVYYLMIQSLDKDEVSFLHLIFKIVFI